jgi:7,8-dihydropterin-6-yl-methyl-4-(beta-D-ribofuranosyl)aminobenzene 5'-phosphate synthase
MAVVWTPPRRREPRVVVPAHCTGWRAQHAMAARFGEAFIPNTIGTRFEL